MPYGVATTSKIGCVSVARIWSTSALLVIVVLPSSEQLPEFVQQLDRSQIVTGDALTSRAERQRRALDIVGDATRSAPRAKPPPTQSASDPQHSLRMKRQTGPTGESLRMPKQGGNE